MRTAIGFLSFVLGVSLLLSGGAFWIEAYRDRNHWMSDSLLEDYRDTTQFRNYICSCLRTFLSMGAAQPLNDYWYGDYGYDWQDFVLEMQEGVAWYGDAGIIPGDGPMSFVTVKRGESEGGPQSTDGAQPTEAQRKDYWRSQAKKIHERMKEDQNLLYRIEGVDKYSNTTDLFHLRPPDGYSFLLYFDGVKVNVYKNGEKIDIYGDGYYAEREDQWYVPGYQNFTVDESLKGVKVTIAAIDEPQLFFQGTYGKGGVSGEANYLYRLRQNLLESREQYEQSLIWMGVGLALVLLCALSFWRGKQIADVKLARLTGKLWFEPKVLLLLAPLLPLLLAVSDRVGEAVPVTVWGDGVWAEAVMDEQWWYLREQVQELLRQRGWLLTAFWCLYLLVNDLRRNYKPWKNGICAMLAASGLKQPIQRRLSRVSGLVALALLLLGAVNLNLLMYAASFSGGARLAGAWTVCLPAVVLLIIATVFLWRLKRVWTDLGTLTDQIAAVRSGDLEHPLIVETDSDLRQAVDDLNHIQQGLHSALDQQTKSERMKVELVTNVSHDLKTPLTSIISYADLLAQEELPPQAADYVHILQEKAARLKAMVQDVFDISKAASGQLPIKPKHLDLGKLLRQTLADMSQAIEDSGLALRTALPEDAVPVYADGDRLYRVFQNLLGNALKYSLPGTRVYLALVTQGRQALVTLKNTSAAELRPGTDYTGRFVRGDESRTDGGSGLGLSIAQSFTQACNGDLRVETDGDLFTVRVTLPLDSLS